MAVCNVFLMIDYWEVTFKIFPTTEFDDEEIELLALERLACMTQEPQY